MAGDQVDHDPMRPLSAFGFGAPSPRSPGHSALSFGISAAWTVLEQLGMFAHLFKDFDFIALNVAQSPTIS